MVVFKLAAPVLSVIGNGAMLWGVARGAISPVSYFVEPACRINCGLGYRQVTFVPRNPRDRPSGFSLCPTALHISSSEYGTGVEYYGEEHFESPFKQATRRVPSSTTTYGQLIVHYGEYLWASPVGALPA